MENKLIITILDEKGAHQFHVHKHLKKIVFFGILIAALIGIVACYSMRTLMRYIDDIELEQNKVVSEYSYLYQQNEDLKEKIREKNDELGVINEKIQDLQSIIDTQKNDKNAIYKKHQLEDLSKLDPAFKTLLLSLIPSGDPLPSYLQKNKALSIINPKIKQELGYSYVLEGKTPVIATANGVIEMAKTSYKGYGNIIKINHSFGFSTIYVAMNENLVKKGDFVQKGDTIGYADQNAYYEVLFLNHILDASPYTKWSEGNFNLIFEDENIQWGDLFYSIEDILKLKNYSLQNEASISVLDENSTTQEGDLP